MRKIIDIFDKDGKKVAEHDLTEATEEELTDFFALQEYLGRRFEYRDEGVAT